MIDSELVAPWRKNKLIDRRIAVAKHLKEINESIIDLKTAMKIRSLNNTIQ